MPLHILRFASQLASANLVHCEGTGEVELGIASAGHGRDDDPLMRQVLACPQAATDSTSHILHFELLHEQQPDRPKESEN